VGKVVELEVAAVTTRTGDFHRARVKLNSAQPLTRFVPLTLEGSERMFLQVKYEKLPKYCEVCGLMGHVYRECGTGEHEEADLQFGSWMVSDESFWKPGTPGLRGRNMKKMKLLGRYKIVVKFNSPLVQNMCGPALLSSRDGSG
jgi:hypothetical protein